MKLDASRTQKSDIADYLIKTNYAYECFLEVEMSVFGGNQKRE